MDKQLSNELRCHGLLPREDIKTISRRNGGLFARITEPVSGKPPASVLSVMVKQEFENQGVNHGALNSHLQKNEQAMDKKNIIVSQATIATTKALIFFCILTLQAAGKLEYLHAKNVLNRDIAVKNCLYGDNKVASGF
ncbi:hypothetical protein KIN20_021911 [Parelaphostrongylus tenuis]|uniref:Serine-threonine/tyrosine-protein kinase catalytic domain-containing protein n=1 Tax=Parelaphostrongylus tenuis TaxID=148309 RepID=A0AAD5QWH2_PARTN|nr:hypothetical protein KIN20_021911 [Parelaphostrongylus tenuis]